MEFPIMGPISAVTSLIPVAVGVSRYKKLNFAMKAFSAFCIVVSVETAAEYVLAFHQINNNFISNAGLGIEPLSVAAVYALALDDKRIRKALLALMIVFVCVWVPDKIFLEIPTEMNEEMSFVSNIFMIAISIIALHTIARRTTDTLISEPLLWITTANILLAAGDMFVLGLSNEILAMGVSYFTAAWTINWSLDTVSYILFAEGLLCKGALQS